ncbi:XdhC family protein [Sporosarcina limicola]|uniref:Xanthine/CO dehydrogenase XdhC/CoxF family maturation factor n=1 Tax=Sporosarcina limicola TaxID=34101 RepID=A0A927MK64_9BACL|nr:XdhC family protein [Sporosarcina limicola]MBE1556103.1 xanthine/CO dehydrogenase XdhC/CoxF family maturation factor [Sporosarcina limicola]
MERLQEIISTILTDDQPTVLATIVHVDGSAYRKEGAWMLLKEDDTRLGVISGGCLESDLHNRAQGLFNTGKTDVFRYDLSAEDDLGWGRGAGCNGVVTVMVRAIDATFRKALTFLNDQLQAKQPVYYMQSMKDFNMYSFISRSGAKFGEVNDETRPELDTATPFQNIAGQVTVCDETVYRQVVWPKPNLYIIGAGADARPLARVAGNVGYAVHLLDWRESLCNELYFPTAESFQLGDLEKLIGNIPFSPLDSVIVMTHDFQQDIKLVQSLCSFQLLYLGVLGSKKRMKRLYGGEVPDWIHSPIGLSIGADGPEEIAVSIVAELIAVRRGKMT